VVTSRVLQLWLVYIGTIPQTFYTVQHNKYIAIAFIQNHWVCGPCQSSVIHVSGKETTTQLSPLQRANLNHWTRLDLSKRPSSVGVSLSTPEEGNRSSFRIIMFYSYLEFLMMDKVHTSSNSECYTPLVFHLGYMYPRRYAKTSYRVSKN
jgi:hypothetical protein